MPIQTRSQTRTNFNFKYAFKHGNPSVLDPTIRFCEGPGGPEQIQNMFSELWSSQCGSDHPFPCVLLKFPSLTDFYRFGLLWDSTSASLFALPEDKRPFVLMVVEHLDTVRVSEGVPFCSMTHFIVRADQHNGWCRDEYGLFHPEYVIPDMFHYSHFDPKYRVEVELPVVPPGSAFDYARTVIFLSNLK